jgi:hypothetical protein
VDWLFYGALAAGAALYAGRGLLRGQRQEAAADAAGLTPVPDLSHVPEVLQQTALWTLADGGFERRVATGSVPSRAGNIEVTAFDLETLRERRGEWAFLPVEPPFRVAGVVSVAACTVDRALPHLLFKRAGRGDELADDTAGERASSLAKATRTALGMKRSYPAELPRTLPSAPLGVSLPAQWRAYGADAVYAAELATNGFAATLAAAGRRDLVIELLGPLVVVYPAARDVAGADAYADLTATAIALAEGVLGATPRRDASPGR